MALGNTRATVLFVKKETTAGTPIDPGAGTDAIELQPDVQMAPNFDSLQNEAMRSSIGVSKPVQGLEQPTGSFSHYLKASGVAGTAPEYGDLLESLFGTTSSNSTERATTTSSTVSLLKLAAGGSDFARGKAVLVKDGANGYSIRPVDSVSTNDLTLGFNMPGSPGSGINVGKCVNYAPANSGHPSFTAWLYRGNGHSIEVLAGAKTASMSASADAGGFLNASFSMEGTKYCFDPIRIAADDTKLDFLDNATTRAATVLAQLYRDPLELAQAIQDSMNSLGSANTFTCEYISSGTDAGKFKFTSNGTTFSLLWNTGVNTANTIGDKIGFATAADDTGSLTYTSDNVQSWAAPYVPSFDSTDPIAAKNLEILLGDSDDTLCFCASTISFQINVTQANVPCICAESGVQEKIATQRQVTVNLTGVLDRHQAELFKKYRSNDQVKFMFNFGPKSGGNWVAGKCGSLYVPTSVISNYTLTDLDSVVALELELTGYVDSDGNGEVYMNFL